MVKRHCDVILLEEADHRRRVFKQFRINGRIESDRADEQIERDDDQQQRFPDRHLPAFGQRHEDRAQRHAQHHAAHRQERGKQQHVAPQVRIEQLRIIEGGVR